MRRITTTLTICALMVTACTAGGDTVRTDGGPLASRLVDRVGSAVDAQVAEGVPPSPLGRILQECLVADADAVAAIGAGLGIDDVAGEVLTVTVADPDGPAPSVSCAISYPNGSAGAVVLSVAPTDADATELRDELAAAAFVEVADASAAGLQDDEVLLFDATTFQASRVVWLADGFSISVTANADLADRGALLDALPVVVAEVSRTLG